MCVCVCVSLQCDSCIVEQLKGGTLRASAGVEGLFSEAQGHVACNPSSNIP